MLGHKLPGLNCCQLAQLRLGMAAEDLEERIERRWRAVVLLVEGGRGRLDTLSVGWGMSVLGREAGGVG
jgi:hypothetical protein